jgi:hypothetical protein
VAARPDRRTGLFHTQNSGGDGHSKASFIRHFEQIRQAVRMLFHAWNPPELAAMALYKRDDFSQTDVNDSA